MCVCSAFLLSSAKSETGVEEDKKRHFKKFYSVTCQVYSIKLVNSPE